MKKAGGGEGGLSLLIARENQKEEGVDKSAVLIAFGMGKTKGSKGGLGGGANSAILRALSLGYATGVGDGDGGLTQSCNT